MDQSKLIDLLVPAARSAGAAIMTFHAKGVVASAKGDGSPVTEADHAAEKIILAAIAKVAPDITVISEENAASHKLEACGRFFLVDPLDGTKEFLKPDCNGSFTVNIALIEDGVPVMGIVYAPALDRLFTGSASTGAFENGKQIQVRDVPDTGLIAVASVSHRDEVTNQWLADQGIEETVSIGSSLKFCLLAAGEADVYPRFGPTMEWDTAAGDAVLRSAGGSVSTPDGELFQYGKSGYLNGAFVARGKM